MENIAGGSPLCPKKCCKHPYRVQTGREREDPRWIFWSQHQYEYYCPKCHRTVWKDEERGTEPSGKPMPQDVEE